MKRNRKIRLTIVGVVLGATMMVLYAFKESQNFKLAKNIEIFSNIVRELNLYYVDPIKPDTLIPSGVDAMLKTLDPYTVYIPESKMADFKFMTTGQYGGIGSLIRKKEDYAIISEVYKGFPADKAGLKAGDKIMEIDDKSIKGLSLNQVSERLKGVPNTEVILTIERPGMEKPMKVKLVRKKVSIPAVPYYGMLEDKIGYIRLSNFTSGAYKEVRGALDDLKKNHGMESVILDLRGNPGGLLVQAIQIVNLFVEKGQTIVSTRGKVKDFDQVYRAPSQPDDPDIPLAVLVNSGSASASEIVAGSIQDLDRGVILGQRTFGKGLVQTTRPVGYGGQLKMTSAKYYIPSGRCIQALDYSHRNPDGSVGHVPDSLISAFKTKNGRTVYDGGGIDPDIHVDAGTLSPITVNLYMRFFIFDYATQFAMDHDSIPPPDKFAITDEILEDFHKFIKEKDFNYDTESESMLDDLIKTARKEDYYDRAAKEFEALKKSLSHNIDSDFYHHRDEISELLKQEITGRYYYQAGKIESTLDQDSVIIRAKNILADPAEYNAILSGQQETAMQ
jgi:carboxyl-terminal processing protease